MSKIPCKGFVDCNTKSCVDGDCMYDDMVISDLKAQLAAAEEKLKEFDELCNLIAEVRQEIADHLKGTLAEKLKAQLIALQKATRWIPVEEGLPEPNETTHPQQSVTVKLATIVEVDAWYEDCDKHWHSSRTGEIITGTHWRPIDLPKGA